MMVAFLLRSVPHGVPLLEGKRGGAVAVDANPLLAAPVAGLAGSEEVQVSGISLFCDHADEDSLFVGEGASFPESAEEDTAGAEAAFELALFHLFAFAGHLSAGCLGGGLHGGSMNVRAAGSQ